MTSTKTKFFNAEAAAETLRRLVAPGDVCELRLLDVQLRGDRRKHNVVSGYFADATAAVESLGGVSAARGCYVTLNPVQPALLARAANRLRVAGRGETTGDTHIVSRRWLYIDVDAVRPSGISSTDAEHRAAHERAQAIYLALTDAGWPEAIYADSGNGAHLLYGLDLAIDDDGLVQRVLERLAERFSDDVVAVDTTVHNPARIVRLYGTRACKGDSTPDRPHRLSRIISTPDNEPDVVPREALEALAGPRPLSPTRPDRRNGNGRKWDVGAWLARHGIVAEEPRPWGGGGQVWVLRQSPMCEHHDGAVHVEQHASGAVSAHCHHNSCTWQWTDLRARYEVTPEHAERNGKPHDGKTTTVSPVLVRLSDVQPEPIRWLWPGRIALGKLTLVAGDPGLGKSLATLDIAARVTTGRQWPDQPEYGPPQGSVVLLSAEDDVGDTIRPRLDAAGADTSRIVELTAIRGTDDEGDYERSVDLSRDVRHVATAIESLGDCRLVVVDPISAYLGKADSHNNAEVRATLAPLSDLAARHRVAIVGVTHLRKGQGPAIYRSIGSLAFVAAARAVWAVTRDSDSDDSTRRLLLPVKCNLAPDLTGLAYRIVETRDRVPHVEWLEAVTVRVDDALAPADGGEGDATALAEACDWLRHVLADGPVEAKKVKQGAHRDGIAARTLDRAKARLAIVAKPDGYKGPWLWRLPDQSAPSAPVTETLAHSDSDGALSTDGGNQSAPNPPECAKPDTQAHPGALCDDDVGEV